MSAILNVAVVALAGASMVAADAGCISLQEAVTQNGLTKLGQAVIAAATGGAATEDLSASTAALLTLAKGTVELAEEDKVTIFAPEDGAWPATLPEGEELLTILLTHVVEEYYNTAGVTEAFATADPAVGITLPTLAPGVEVTATMDGADVFVAATGQNPPGAMVVTPDIETCVGVIQIIDALLIAGGDAMAPGADVPGADVAGDDVTGDDVSGAPMPAGAPAGGPGGAGAGAPAGADVVDVTVAGGAAEAPAGAGMDAAGPAGDDTTNRDLDLDTATDGGDAAVGVETDNRASAMLVSSVLSAVAAAVALLA